ncbi:putative damage-inducible protein DinB/putative intracellular protease/amidase [Bacillus capparidis]|uniref:Damage-inducible protein DinB/putative intracellular protease/amidase n=1 Tax=Bacillus capparidis TaxID=1840411 RepID=A0ABS4CXW7_9BACI|nr:putative damage-inducible protein DinB/putative intracellular protease/amidase [Bacillus capparidis]
MKEVLVFLTDGFADWEASYVMAELNQPHTDYQIKTIAIDTEPKQSMGGLRVLPDYSLKDFANVSNVAMFILPGGNDWRNERNHKAKDLIEECLKHNIPVAAICDAGTFLAKYGFLDNNKHTGYTLSYLKQNAPNYRGDENYIDAQAICDGNIITANETAALEFSKLILDQLGVMKSEQLDEWYAVFKKGLYPQETEGTSTDHSLQHYDYHVWANRKVFKHLNELPRDIYTQEIQSVFPSISDAAAHIYLVDNVWLFVLSGHSFDETVRMRDLWIEETKGVSLEEMEKLYENLTERFQEFFHQAGDMETIASYSHPRYGTLKASHSELVQHVVNHGTYHRGNITAMLRQLGHPGVPTDFAFYLFETKKLEDQPH